MQPLRDYAAAVVALCEALETELFFDEKTGEYYYDEVTLKRWVLGDGGVSGNCELCNENADLGWIDQDDIYEGVEDDIDEPPAHPNCDCTVEFKDTRKRVYV